MASSRIKNSITNILTGAFGQILNIVLNFALRTVFLYSLGMEYAGINGVLSGVLQVLNLANLGIDGAIVYAMYKPLAEKNIDQSKALVAFYRKAYRLIGFLILAVGLALIPVLPYLLKDSTELVDIRIVYCLYLAETVSTYWFFSYLGTVLQADQRKYVITRITYFTQTASTIVKAVVLFALRGTPALCFYVFTGTGAVFTVVQNLLTRVRCRKLYPWLRENDARALTREERGGIFRNVAGMFTNNVCRVLNDGIDTTVISAMVGVAYSGVFTNYVALRQYVVNVIRTVLDPLTASVGNLCAVESAEKKESFFNRLQFTCFWIYGFSAIGLWILSDHFIAGVWLHSTDWLLPAGSVLFYAFNLAIEGMAKAVIIYRDANGLYWQTKYRYIFSSVFNAVLSIVLVGPVGLGVTGALVGTTASLLIMLSFDPVLVFREVFHKKAWGYYRTYLCYLALTAATGALVYVLALPFSEYTVVNFLVRLLLCLVVPNGLWFLLFRKNENFLYLRDTALGLLRSLRKKAGK